MASSAEKRLSTWPGYGAMFVPQVLTAIATSACRRSQSLGANRLGR